jgi:hypothetical protein
VLELRGRPGQNRERIGDSQNMPLRVTDSSGIPDIKVFIQNPEGKYLAGDAESWFFSEDRTRALVLNYKGDRVAEQLEGIRRSQGITLKSVPVPLAEVYETCDRCQELFMPSMILFDGKQFVCADCRSRAARRPIRK